MEEKWFVARKRHVPCVWPQRTFWAWPVHEYFGVQTTGKVLSVCDKGEYQAIYERDKTSFQLGTAIAEKVLAIPDMRIQRSKGIEVMEETVAFTKAFAAKSATATLDEYISFFDAFTLQHPKVMKENMHLWLMSSPIIEKMVRKELSSRSQEEIDEIFTIMAVPVEASYSNKIEKELNHLTDLARDQGVGAISKEIQDFSNKYYWFPYEYVGPGIWDTKAVTALIERKLTEAKVAGHVVAGDEVMQKKCIADFGLSQNSVRLFNIIQMLTLLSDDRKRYNSELCYYLNGVIIGNLANKLSISREEALYVDQGFLKIFQEDKELFKKKIVDRKEMYVEITEDGVCSWYDGRKEGIDFLHSLDIYLDFDKSITEVKGQIAYKGKVTGRVRVLKTSHVNDFKEGEIIVTGMTTPDFIPLIRIAGAIVTNEGGVTCHAAIVAREMKKPCIIGTKIATQVFKDGDTVEVDAESGIVKLLN
ncbi:MAG: hypothetical protein RIT04_421 [Candidatus Parcubacteria bacterium]